MAVTFQQTVQKSNVVLYTNSFVVCIKTDDICKDITEDVEARFDASSCELHWIREECLREKSKKIIVLMED